MPPYSKIALFSACLLVATHAFGAETQPADKSPLPSLVDTIASRHDVPLSGSWDIVLPEKVVDAGTGDVPVVVALYALRDAAGLRALLLTQRNVLPGPSGWGPPSLCAAGASQLGVDVYRSPRDVLCGWAEHVSFTGAGNRTHLGSIADLALGEKGGALTGRSERWLLVGLRVSNRQDFLDLQLLLPDQPSVSTDHAKQFMADMEHSIGTTWLADVPTAVPMPPPQAEKKPTPAEDGSWWDGTLSLSAMKTMTYRVGVSIKTFAVASVMAGNAATGGAIITVLNVTSTGIYLLNDYVWETLHPLAATPQDFEQLVDRPR